MNNPLPTARHIPIILYDAGRLASAEAVEVAVEVAEEVLVAVVVVSVASAASRAMCKAALYKMLPAASMAKKGARGGNTE